MNSYPGELLAQLVPIMFVAGLGSSPPHPNPRHRPQRPRFALLVSRLCDVLHSQLRPSVWAPERNMSFQMVFVEKNVRFPPRRLVSPEDPAYASARSPLSPLIPSSPLYPDGLIAPIWIRKYTAFIPSVFVLFLYLFEVATHPARCPWRGARSRLRRGGVEEGAELSAEIAQRMKITSERGVKLTVVLLASRRMLGMAPRRFSPCQRVTCTLTGPGKGRVVEAKWQERVDRSSFGIEGAI